MDNASSVIISTHATTSGVKRKNVGAVEVLRRRKHCALSIDSGIYNFTG
jgi:hypothetical protein